MATLPTRRGGEGEKARLWRFMGDSMGDQKMVEFARGEKQGKKGRGDVSVVPVS